MNSEVICKNKIEITYPRDKMTICVRHENDRANKMCTKVWVRARAKNVADSTGNSHISTTISRIFSLPSAAVKSSVWHSEVKQLSRTTTSRQAACEATVLDRNKNVTTHAGIPRKQK